MKHTVYTIRGVELIAWTDITPEQVGNQGGGMLLEGGIFT
jgi:hypothetical protein